MTHVEHFEYSFRGHVDPPKGPRFRAPRGGCLGPLSTSRCPGQGAQAAPAVRSLGLSPGQMQDRWRELAGRPLLCSLCHRSLPAPSPTLPPDVAWTAEASPWPSLGLPPSRVSHDDADSSQDACTPPAAPAAHTHGWDLQGPGAGTHWLQVGDPAQELVGWGRAEGCSEVYPIDLLPIQIKY